MRRAIAQGHVIAGLAALLLGSVVFLMRTGTRLHVRVGFGYIGSMLIVNVTAFCRRTAPSA